MTEGSPAPPGTLRLRVFVPTETLLDLAVSAVSAESVEGAFTLLPRRLDLAAALVPGILAYRTPDGDEGFVALDEGVLVKAADEVRVSTFRAVAGADLARLRQTLEASLLALDAHEREARRALARLEAGTLRRFAEWERQPA